METEIKLAKYFKTVYWPRTNYMSVTLKGSRIFNASGFLYESFGGYMWTQM